MNNAISKGNVIEYTNSTGSKINSGAVVAIGKFCGVAVTDIANGATGAVAVEGIFKVTKKTKTDVINLGDHLVYSSGVKVASAASTLDAVTVGYAVKASAATDEDVVVKLG